MTEVSQHSSLQRHRPTPLATPQPPVQRTQGGGIHDRAQLLSGLRTARPNPTTPMSAFAPPTNYQQQAYLQLLQQQQVLMQQSHMILQQQQLQQQQQYEAELLARRRPTEPPVVIPRSEEQAERFLETRRRMQQDAAVVAAPPRFGQTLGLQEEDEESVRGNPLAASALARRKRQSLTMESHPPQTPTPTTAAQRRVSYGAPPTAAQQAQFGHRRTSSSASAQSARSDSIPTSWTPGKLSPTLTDPPALILSKPGEAYPSTSSAGSDDGDKTSFKAPPARPTLDKARLRTGKSSTSSGHSQTSSISSTSDDGVRPIAPWLAGVTEAGATSPPAEVDAPRRPSQAGTLTAALSGRRQRPVSLGGPPTGSSHLSIDVAKGNNYGGLTTGGGASFFPNQQGQPRSVSDSSALSPFATTFQPLPVSPFTPSAAAYAAYAMGMNTPIAPTSSRQSPPAVNGTATPIRQPRGPAVEAELSSSNFATRVRKSAIGRLTVGRLSIGGAGGGL